MASTLKNLGWKFMERSFSQVVQLFVSIILARLLLPSDYGAVAMVTIFIALFNVIIEGGFSGALVQKKDADDLDFSTILYFSIGLSTLLYGILFISAPYISSFYGKEYQILTPIFRVLGLQMIIYAVNSVQQAYVQKEMMFKNFFWATLVGIIASAIVGITMAYSGYGIWAIVAQQLTSNIVNTLTLYYITRKLPICAFSFKRLKSMFNYGVKLLGTNLLITAFLELRAIIIGKMYSAQDLAFFDRGRQFPNLIVNNINSSISAVLFPKMAKEQNNPEQIKRTTRNSIRFSAYIMTPLMFGLAAVAEPFIRFILTEKWVGCAPLMQWFCIVYLFMPIHTANMQAIKALGKSDTLLKLETIKKTIEIATLLLVMWISVEAIVINIAILTTLFTAINATPNKKLLNYNFKEQVWDILPPIILSTIMFLIITVFNHLTNWRDIVTLITDIIIGITTYITLSAISKNKEFLFIINNIKRYVK